MDKIKNYCEDSDPGDDHQPAGVPDQTKTPEDAALNFLLMHAPNGPWALTAISETKEVKGLTFLPSEATQTLAWIRAHNGTKNLYFHGNEVRKGFSKSKASKNDIAVVRILHVDIDPQVGKNLKAEQDRIRDLLTDNLPEGIPPPSSIIFSGGGYQAIWKLSEPIVLGGDIARIEEVEGYNKRLADALGGDNCHNIDRLMRLPGSLNIPNELKMKKGQKPTYACLVKTNNETFSLSDFKLSPKANGTGQKSKAGGAGEESGKRRTASLDGISERTATIIKLGHIPGETKEGDNSRSSWLFDALCNLIREKKSDEDIYLLITDPANAISESILEKGEGKYEAYARRQIARAHLKIAENEQPQLRKMNERHALIKNYGGKTRVMTEGEVLNFQEVGDFKNGYLNCFTYVGKNSKPIAQWWLTHPQCRKYERVEFLPGLEPNAEVFNLWRGWTVEAHAGDCSKFLKFVDEVICSGDGQIRDWVLDWMAHAVQKPYEPAEVAIALRGGQGTGKSFFARHFGQLFGDHFVPVTDPRHLVGNFNALLQRALLVFADEAFAANDKKLDGILKGLVTEPTIVIEPKGVDPFKVKKYLRLILASNRSWIVSTDIDDRRFLVLDVKPSHKQDHAYFAEIETEWNAGGKEAFMHFLLARDISKFDHRERPPTAALDTQKVNSLTGARRIVYDMLATGRSGGQKNENGSVFVLTQDVHESCNKRVSEAAIGRELGRISRNATSTREVIEGKQKRGYWLHPLVRAREVWASATGVNPEWPSDDGVWEEVDAAAGDDF